MRLAPGVKLPSANHACVRPGVKLPSANHACVRPGVNRAQQTERVLSLR